MYVGSSLKLNQTTEIHYNTSIFCTHSKSCLRKTSWYRNIEFAHFYTLVSNRLRCEDLRIWNRYLMLANRSKWKETHVTQLRVGDRRASVSSCVRVETGRTWLKLGSCSSLTRAGLPDFFGTWYQNREKCTKWTQNVPMVIKYSKYL
jgi:hypothetical protein